SKRDWSSDVCSSDLPSVPPRPVVDRDDPGRGHLSGRPRIQPAGRRVARRARPQGAVTATPLLTVDDLWVRFPGRAGLVEAVRGIGFEVGREKLGIVGESGSGKTMTGRAILRLVPRPGRVTARRLEFDGIDLLSI